MILEYYHVLQLNRASTLLEICYRRLGVPRGADIRRIQAPRNQSLGFVFFGRYRNEVNLGQRLLLAITG